MMSCTRCDVHSLSVRRTTLSCVGMPTLKGRWCNTCSVVLFRALSAGCISGSDWSLGSAHPLVQPNDVLQPVKPATVEIFSTPDGIRRDRKKGDGMKLNLSVKAGRWMRVGWALLVEATGAARCSDCDAEGRKTVGTKVVVATDEYSYDDVLCVTHAFEHFELHGERVLMGGLPIGETV